MLSHSNIIKLCGTGGTPGHPNAFIILDRLYGTLGDRIEVWKMKEREYSGIIKKKKSQLKMLFNDRLLAGFDIARAMKYLHDHDIMYRDLKPGEFSCLNWLYEEISFYLELKSIISFPMIRKYWI